MGNWGLQASSQRGAAWILEPDGALPHMIPKLSGLFRWHRAPAVGQQAKFSWVRKPGLFSMGASTRPGSECPPGDSPASPPAPASTRAHQLPQAITYKGNVPAA